MSLCDLLVFYEGSSLFCLCFFLGSTQENLVFYESCFSEDELRVVVYQKVSQTIENYRDMSKVESLTYVFYDRCGTWAP